MVEENSNYGRVTVTWWLSRKPVFSDFSFNFSAIPGSLRYVIALFHDFCLPRQLRTSGCHWNWFLWYYPQSTMENGWFGACYPRLTALLADIRAQGTKHREDKQARWKVDCSRSVRLNIPVISPLTDDDNAQKHSQGPSS